MTTGAGKGGDGGDAEVEGGRGGEGGNAPWNGVADISYTCENLYAGFCYDEVFWMTVDGVSKSVTNSAAQALDVDAPSVSKLYRLDGAALFGPNVRPTEAKVQIELIRHRAAE